MRALPSRPHQREFAVDRDRRPTAHRPACRRRAARLPADRRRASGSCRGCRGGCSAAPGYAASVVACSTTRRGARVGRSRNAARHENSLRPAHRRAARRCPAAACRDGRRAAPPGRPGGRPGRPTGRRRAPCCSRQRSRTCGPEAVEVRFEEHRPAELAAPRAARAGSGSRSRSAVLVDRQQPAPGAWPAPRARAPAAASSVKGLSTTTCLPASSAARASG